MIHQWVYVIIPTFNNSMNPVYFAAYCKGCGDYFTEPMDIGVVAMQTPGNLPFDGCTGRRNTIEVPAPE